MKGLQLLTHSIRQVTGNLDGAIKVSALPFALQVVAGLVFAGGVVGIVPGGNGTPSAGAVGAIGLTGLLALIVAVVTSLWIAVAWHRYILLNEAPVGFVPAFDKDRILAYFIRTLGYAIILIVIAMVLGLVIGGLLVPLVTSGRVGLAMILSALLIQLPLAIISFRLTAGLPGAALGRGTDFMAGWEATRGATVDIAVLAVLAVAANLFLGLIDYYIFSGVRVLSVLWGAIVTWLVTMVGISILTTLYGHYVERRPLV